jgi:hypothetical protein
MKGSFATTLCFNRYSAVHLAIPVLVLLAGCSDRVAGPDYALPAPSRLQIVASNPESVSLDWLDNSEDESGFIVWQSLYRNRGYREAALVDRDVTSVTINGLSDTLEYYFRTSAYNEAGNSRKSNSVLKSIRRFALGDTLTDYLAIDHNYQDVHLYDFKGKVIFIYFAEQEEG